MHSLLGRAPLERIIRRAAAQRGRTNEVTWRRRLGRVVEKPNLRMVVGARRSGGPGLCAALLSRVRSTRRPLARFALGTVRLVRSAHRIAGSGASWAPARRTYVRCSILKCIVRKVAHWTSCRPRRRLGTPPARGFFTHGLGLGLGRRHMPAATTAGIRVLAFTLLSQPHGVALALRLCFKRLCVADGHGRKLRKLRGTELALRVVSCGAQRLERHKHRRVPSSRVVDKRGMRLDWRHSACTRVQHGGVVRRAACAARTTRAWPTPMTMLIVAPRTKT